jgi:hypothetical protein
MTTAHHIRWLLLTASLAGRPASTARVRLWRALKELGVGSLRDGVSVLPASEAARAALDALAAEIATDGGATWLLELPAQPAVVEQALVGLFDRAADYAELSQAMTALAGELPGLDEAGVRRRLRQLDKALVELEHLDYFPGVPRGQARAARTALEGEINRRFSPAEPAPTEGRVLTLALRDYRGRTWATRRRLWVDRVASAWLVHRHIDPDARFLWLGSPADCPADALGFDFDGAAFSHAFIQGHQRVTFEVLLASFGLETDAGLARLATLVRYLDIGGLPVAEAAGFEAILAGLRDGCPDDDALLIAASPLLDALYRRFSVAT